MWWLELFLMVVASSTTLSKGNPSNAQKCQDQAGWQGGRASSNGRLASGQLQGCSEVGGGKR